jgi:hypothetical protein
MRTADSHPPIDTSPSRRHFCSMIARPPKPLAAKAREQTAKNERLARALRENLRRRKAQAGARRDPPAADLSGTEVSPKSKRGD